MTDLELLVLRSISSDARIIAYRPRLRKIAGSVASTILLQQIVFRWENNDFQPFYKYKEPCAAHDYRKGDSWSEELGFSREEFDTALKHIGQKVKGPALRDYSQRDHDKLVWWWVMPDRKTWYEVNYVALCKAATPLYVGREPRFTSGVNPALPTLYTENTSEITTERVEGDHSPIGNSPAPTPPQPAPAPLATPLIDRAVALAEAESFDGPNAAKATIPPRLQTRKMLQKDGPHFKQSDVVGDYFPAGKGTNPVQIYFERFSPYEYKLSDPQQYDMVNAVTNLDLWREVVAAWDNAGFKGTNRKGLSDWYKNPSRFREQPTTYTNGTANPAAAADLTFKQFLLKHYHTDVAAAITRGTNKTERELRDEYNQWRTGLGRPTNANHPG